METISRSLLTFLLNSVWQIPLAAAVAALACRVMRNGPARNRHTVWVAAMAMAILLPLVSTRHNEQPPAPQFAIAWRAPVPVSAAPGPHLKARTPRSPAPASDLRTVSVTQTTAKLMLGAFCLLILFRLMVLVRAAIRTVQIWRSAHAAELPEQLERVLGRCSARFELARVRLLFSPDVPGPVMVGRSIILPEELLEEPSEDVLTAAVGHEMAHIARRDFLWNLLVEVLCLPVSFHPAVWQIRRSIERSREIACDELVTELLIDARVYAGAMVRMAASMSALAGPGYLLGVFDGDMLEDRIRRLLRGRSSGFRRSRLFLVAGLSTMAVCGVIASGLALSARAQGSTSGVLKQGLAAYGRGDYREAAQQFQKAIEAEPTNVKAKLLLANAWSAESASGADTANTPLVAAARNQYLDVLALDRGNRQALHGLLASYMNAKQFAEAHEWALRTIQADSADKSAYYAAGFADWAMVWPNYASARQSSGMQSEDAGMIPDADLRQNLRTRHMAGIEDGIRMMGTALQLDPDYSDAMEYAGLLYRMESAIADSVGQSADLIARADDWAKRALASRNRRAPVAAPRAAAVDEEQSIASPPSLPSPPPPPPGWHGSTNPPKLVRETRAFIPTEVLKSYSGLVQLSVIIRKDGTVRQVDVLRGPLPLATPLAAAVRSWVYEPTLIDGNPVEVTTMVAVQIVSPTS